MRSKYLFFAIAIAISGLGGARSTQAAADIGDLIKCSDFSSVYYLAEDGNRYAFPNENTYFTWYRNFDSVKTVSCEDLASLKLAGNVPYQSGTRLLKLQSVPTVYFVEPSGILRAIQTEEQARNMLGDDWAKRVDDLPDAFFTTYEVGEDIAEDELPEGLIVQEDDGTLLRIDDSEQGVEIDDLLESEDKEELFKSFAIEVDDLELKLKIEINITDLSSIDLAELTALLEKLQTIDVADESEIEIEIEIEEEDEDGDNTDEAREEISEAAGEIERAQNRIQERHQNGKDVTDAESLLRQAQDLYALALEAFESGDYDLAEQYAEDAQGYAEDARMGSAVNSSDDDEGDDSEDSENSADESDSADELDSSDADSGDEDDSSDEDDSVDEEDESGGSEDSGSEDGGSSEGSDSGSDN